VLTTQYFCSLPNPKSIGSPVHLFLDDDDPQREIKLAHFLQNEDRHGRGVYQCIGWLRHRARVRNVQNVVALPFIVSDLDLKNIAEPRDTAIECLRNLPLPPTEIRDSGNGLHAVWRLKEPVTDEDGLAQAEATMKRLARLLAADPAPTHRAALLRCLGTHNTKDGHRKLCHVI
jgi:hypothetical protein